MIDILLPAFILSIVLLGIHSYFGLRIIRRGIIFIDLAIGQMAALGAAISIIFLEGKMIYPLSLVFSLCGGLLIAYSIKRTKHLEAVIGLLYALGISAVFILFSKSPHGMEEFQSLMAHDILFTGMPTIAATAALYLCIGLILYLLIPRMDEGKRELVFFLGFAVTVTSSVRIAGVLVVFAILLAPAFISIQMASLRKMPSVIRKYPLIAAWIIGIVVNLLSIVMSYTWDLPTGYAIVFTHCFLAATTAMLVIRKGNGAA
jgi:zinc/manganese transport system permease protein